MGDCKKEGVKVDPLEREIWKETFRAWSLKDIQNDFHEGAVVVQLGRTWELEGDPFKTIVENMGQPERRED